MNIITKTVILRAAPTPPFVGTRLSVIVDDTLVWGVKSAALAEGHDTVSIDWGDGAVESFSSIADLTHTYAAPGSYEVRISDDIAAIACSAASGDFRTAYAPMIRSVISNATNLSELSQSAFAQAKNLTAAQLPVALVNLAAFAGCTALCDVRLPGATDVKCSILPMRPFYQCGSLYEIHFGRANEAAITSCSGYKTDATFGSVQGVCVFDL